MNFDFVLLQVRQARNSIMHSVNMKLSEADFMALTQAMMTLLQDPKIIATQPSAQKASSEILKVYIRKRFPATLILVINRYIR